MLTIPGTPEGREGIWLITPETAVALIEALPGDEVHNVLGSGVFIGANWEKAHALKFLREPGKRLALVFAPNFTYRHQLVALTDEKRWGFDVGEITEEQMVVEEVSHA